MKRYRKKRKLSQAQLAELSKCSQNYIALIERGKNSPSLTMLNKIAMALKIDSINLFDTRSLIYYTHEKLYIELKKVF
jgi:transcriptional regulator with XRE-family HTH domain